MIEMLCTPAPASMVVQQLHGGSTADTTLLAFGYEYDRVGKLTGVADWRGRGPSSSPRINDLAAPHPASNPALVPGREGYHRSGFPIAFDTQMTAPSSFNGGPVYSETGWPAGAAPSDARLDYDG
ncbi:MAG: hypothetical protein R6V85_00005, partial [Polyangia bacterium]